MRTLLAAVLVLLTACSTPPPPDDRADLAAPSDAAASADLAARPDLTSPVDLAAAPDLAFAPDLAAPRDSSTAPDLASPPDLARPPDLASTDGGSAFENQIAGIWLIGWSGGLEHYSWVRFTPGGRLDVLPPKGNVVWTPFWMNCSGAGQWTLAARPQTVQLALPMGCNPQTEVLTFSVFRPGGWPGVIQTAAVEQNPSKGPLSGHQFGPGQCDQMFTSCKLPF